MRRDAPMLRQCRPCLQIAHELGECLGGEDRVGVQRMRRVHVAARRASDAEVDAAGRQRLEHAELLGDLERRVVRQHDARAADADSRRARRDRRHEDLGARADDGREAVVLAEPEPVVAERLAVHGEVQRVADRRVLATAVDGDGLV
jgi:hypothetical protein